MASTFLVCLIGSGFFVWELLRRAHTKDEGIRSGALVLAFVFVLCTVPISSMDIAEHLMHYRKPNLQKYIVRILALVPLYTIESFLSLLLPPKSALYVETVRDAYEAYVIYSFLYFLLEACGSELRLCNRLREKPVSYGKHHAPLHLCLRQWRLGSEYVARCKQGVLQYVIFKVACTIAILIMHHFDVYKEGSFSPTAGYVWMSLIGNLSYLWAIYALVMFYQAAREELAHLRPLGKFMVVKAVVFFSWWQSIVIAALVHAGVIGNGLAGLEADVAARGLQNILICIEMLLAALAHRYAFSFRDFQQRVEGPNSFGIGALARTVASREGRGRAANAGRNQGQAYIYLSLLDDGESLNAVGGIGEEMSGAGSMCGKGKLLVDDAAEVRAAKTQEPDALLTSSETVGDHTKPGIMSALLESSLPVDLMQALRQDMMPGRGGRPTRRSAQHISADQLALTSNNSTPSSLELPEPSGRRVTLGYVMQSETRSDDGIRSPRSTQGLGATVSLTPDSSALPGLVRTAVGPASALRGLQQGPVSRLDMYWGSEHSHTQATPTGFGDDPTRYHTATAEVAQQSLINIYSYRHIYTVGSRQTGSSAHSASEEERKIASWLDHSP